ncbi:MAG: hypothetical protein VB858_03870 [Planctomycetaceae bacterium]
MWKISLCATVSRNGYHVSTGDAGYRCRDAPLPISKRQPQPKILITLPGCETQEQLNIQKSTGKATG